MDCIVLVSGDLIFAPAITKFRVGIFVSSALQAMTTMARPGSRRGGPEFFRNILDLQRSSAMSLRLPEQIETELMAEVLEAINADEEFVVTFHAYHRTDSEPGIQVDENDRQVVMLSCRPTSACSFSIDPMHIARLLALPVVQMFQRDGETFLRVCGMYEGFVTLVDFFTMPLSE